MRYLLAIYPRMRSSALTRVRRIIHVLGQVKRSREKKGAVKRSRAVLGQSQAVKIDFRRSRILTPVANGPIASIGVTTPCNIIMLYEMSRVLYAML